MGRNQQRLLTSPIFGSTPCITLQLLLLPPRFDTSIQLPFHLVFPKTETTDDYSRLQTTFESTGGTSMIFIQVGMKSSAQRDLGKAKLSFVIST